MVLTDEQKAEVAVNRANYEKLKAAGAGRAPRALPELTKKDGAAIPRRRDHRARKPFPAAGIFSAGSIAAKACACSPPTEARRSRSWSGTHRMIRERINAADTVKAQWSAALRKGRVILSDMGKVVALDRGGHLRRP